LELLGSEALKFTKPSILLINTQMVEAAGIEAIEVRFIWFRKYRISPRKHYRKHIFQKLNSFDRKGKYTK